MAAYRQKKNTIVFVCFLLAACVCYLLTRSEPESFDVLMFCANFGIYAGLILFWIHTVRVRLLPTDAQRYILHAGRLMLVLLVMRVIKYRIIVSNVVLVRYLGYLYNVPMILIPAMFLMTAICIRRGNRGKGYREERKIMVPALVLVFLVLTNDIHYACYAPKVPMSQFDLSGGTFTYHFLFYVLYVWVSVTLTIGIVLLFIERGVWSSRTAIALILNIVLWISCIALCLFVFSRYDTKRPFNTPEVHIFAMLATFEICIRRRLIPHNENYAGFFAQLDVPVTITDVSFKPAYRTQKAVPASEEQLAGALIGPVHVNEDTRLSGIPVRAGFVFWTEDESELHRENRRLESAVEILSEENHLIEAEQKLREKQAQLAAQNLVYDRISEALYPKQKRIEELLERAKPGTPEFRGALAEVCVLNAYSKRKSNLLLLSEETLPARNRELFLALAETARFLRCCGVEAAAVGEEYSDVSLPMIHKLYDTFETVIEAYLPVLRRATISLIGDGVRLAVEATSHPDIPPTVLSVERLQSDDCTFLTIRGEEVSADE
ncbi:MAG: hypothetical protein J5645_09435 [Lachnospiraceae bacterium]|nr:hypothetical protein [Lachnospiraceae bacterium]